MHTRQVRLCGAPAGMRGRYLQAKKKKPSNFKISRNLININ